MVLYSRTVLAAVALSGLVLSAQPAPPMFEVGTAKMSQPTSDGPFSVVPVNPGVRNGTFGARFMTLKTLLAYAHDVSEVQVSGPDWIAKNQYDIAATVPEGTQPNDVRGMLRAFLADRFKLVTRSATQRMDALALVVAEKGLKLHLMVAGESFNPDIPDGSTGLIVQRGNMRRWADLLTRVMGSPVIDQTGLQDGYVGAVAYTPFDQIGDGPSEFPAFPVALKEQAGLELIKRTLPVNMLIVDRGNEVPEEN